MTPARRLLSCAWLIALLFAGAFLIWTNSERLQRVQQVTATDREDAVIDHASPTGYADGKRWLIVPERNHRSYEWISQTQQMLAQGQWRVRHVDYDNAPAGRDVHAAAPYRWWLGLIAWCDHAILDHPLGLSVERAALVADPLLHFLLLVGTTFFVARQCGNWPAAFIAIGLATFFPFAGGFLPGAPDDQSLVRICTLWSVLPLLAAMHQRATSSGSEVARTRRLFLLAGIAGGCGLWISARHQAPILAGITVGAVVASWIRARHSGNNAASLPAFTPWRMWALAGAVASISGYLIEYFPSHLGLRLEVNHPLYAVAWIGAGELLTQIDAWFRQKNLAWNRRNAVIIPLAIAAIAALPVAMSLGDIRSPWAGDLLASRLIFLPNGVVAGGLFDWINRDGVTGAVFATGLPLLLVGLAVWLLALRSAVPVPRAALAIALGPVIVALAFSIQQLSWWGLFDAALLALVVAITSALVPLLTSNFRRGLAIGLVAVIVTPGTWLLRPLPADGKDLAYTPLEAMGLIERTLAHWIADHADPGGAVILVPPDRTVNLCFHGGLKGLGSAAWENRAGLEATGQIVAATTGDEALARLTERGITHLILPSWDSDLDQFARWMLHDPEDAFITALHHWRLPVWLRPFPYKLPANTGFDDQAVVILKVTDDSNRPAAVARLAEYFLETGQMENAAASVKPLQQYPTDLTALVALAQVQKALGNSEEFARTLDSVVSSVAAGSDRVLAWDRRVSLAAVLALGDRRDLAREQVQRCLQGIDEDRLRSLTTGSLLRLHSLARLYDLPFGDEEQRALARKLLPAELRSRF